MRFSRRVGAGGPLAWALAIAVWAPVLSGCALFSLYPAVSKPDQECDSGGYGAPSPGNSYSPEPGYGDVSNSYVDQHWNELLAVRPA